MNEPVMSLPYAARLAIMLAGRYRPGQHQHRNGFLPHVFAISPWLGAVMVALIVVVGLGAGSDQEGWPGLERHPLVCAVRRDDLRVCWPGELRLRTDGSRRVGWCRMSRQ
jgi:hypothetical protein